MNWERFKEQFPTAILGIVSTAILAGGGAIFYLVDRVAKVEAATVGLGKSVEAISKMPQQYFHHT